MNWEEGIDYARLTYTDAKRGYWAYECYRNAVTDVARFYAGEAEMKPWSFQGYAGEQAGKAASGWRDDGAILQVTGYWGAAPALLEVPYTGVPRLDIQVTVWGAPDPAGEPRRAADASFAASKRASSRPWRVALIEGYGNGDTCYLGSRQSESFIRVYDKGAEKGEEVYAGSTRYEVQLSGIKAAKVYAAIRARPTEAGCVASYVSGFLAERGISLPDGLSLDGKPRVLARQEPSTAEQSIRWLEKQVAPTVNKLLRKGVPYERIHEILFHVKPGGELAEKCYLTYNHEIE